MVEIAPWTWRNPILLCALSHRRAGRLFFCSPSLFPPAPRLFLLIPGIIGVVCWLNRHTNEVGFQSSIPPQAAPLCAPAISAPGLEGACRPGILAGFPAGLQ